MTVGKLIPVGRTIPSLDLADCDAQVLSQHLKGIKGLKFSVVTTQILLQASAQTMHGWLLRFLCSLKVVYDPKLQARLICHYRKSDFWPL